MDSTNNQTAAEAAGAPEPAAPTAEQPTKSAAETKLEGQLADAKTKGEGYKRERDAARKDLATASKERDELRTANASLQQQLDEANKPKEQPVDEQTATTATQEPSEEDNIRDVLKRNGLKKCWMLPSGGPCFSEAHAREYAGDDFDTLTVISAE